MPGETDGAPDELSALLSDLEKDDAGASDPSGDDGAAKQSHGAQDPDKEQKLLAGRFKSPQDLEKSYLSLRKRLDGGSAKLKELHGVLSNPRLHQLAAQDPEVKAALAKAGYQLAEEQERQDSRNDRPWNGDENDPLYVAQLVREENRLEWEFFRFEKALGRDVTKQEAESIKSVLQNVPDLSVEQAWKLTDEYEKSVAEKQKKAMEEARTKFGGKARPSPTPVKLPGEKLDMKKPVTQMSESERRAFIMSKLEG